jgi:hypothetical protein
MVMSGSRILPLIFLAALGFSADSDEEGTVTYDPAQFRSKAGQGISIPDPRQEAEADPSGSLELPDGVDPALLGLSPEGVPEEQPDPDRPPGQLLGGVEIFYEKIRHEADHILQWQSPLVQGADAWPDKVRFLPGPDGPEPDRVHLDTRYTELETVNMLALLRPKRITIDRAPWTLGDGPVDYRVVLEELGDFKAEVPRKNKEWLTVTGWGRHLILELRCNVIKGRLADPRLRAVHLVGAASHGAVDPEHRAWLEIWDPERPSRILSKRISVHFDENGELKGYSTGEDTDLKGIPRGTPIRDMESYHIAADPVLEQRKAERREAAAKAAAQPAGLVLPTAPPAE